MAPLTRGSLCIVAVISGLGFRGPIQAANLSLFFIGLMDTRSAMFFAFGPVLRQFRRRCGLHYVLGLRHLSGRTTSQNNKLLGLERLSRLEIL